MHYTYMKPKSSYAFGFGFGTVLPVNCLTILNFFSASGFEMQKILAKSIFYAMQHMKSLRTKMFHKDWSGIEQGWIYGEWETGPWWGFRTKDKEAGKYGLVGS